jgi:hypothetical protein
VGGGVAIGSHGRSKLQRCKRRGSYLNSRRELVLEGRQICQSGIEEWEGKKRNEYGREWTAKPAEEGIRLVRAW